jgi:transposase
MTGIAAGQGMEPGNGSWSVCGPAATWTRPGIGPRRSTPPSCVPISAPPEPATHRPRTSRPSDWHPPPCPVPPARGAAPKARPVGNRTGKGHAPDREGLGHSRGGLTSKIHLLADRRCRVLARVTGAGNRHDSLAFEPVMSRLRIPRPGPGRPRTRPARLLGDKAYSNAAIRSYLRRRHIMTTIPEPADQIRNRRARGTRGGRPPAFNPTAYKDRNVAERAINKLKDFRAVATRLDKRDYIWRGTVDAATIRIWLRDFDP